MIAAATATDSGGDRSSKASKAPKPGPAIGPDGQPRKMTAYELAVSQLPPELVAADPKEEKNWKGIGFSVLAIAVVLSLVVIACFFVTPKSVDVEFGEEFSFDDFFDEEFIPKKFEGGWVGDKNIVVYKTDNGEIEARDFDRESRITIMDNATYKTRNPTFYYMSSDLKYVLLAKNVEHVHRHSFLATYEIYNAVTREIIQLIPPQPPGANPPAHEEDRALQYAAWAPDGLALSFVYKNNLYFQPKPDLTASQLTVDGQAGNVYHGIPDWMYEEEILGSNAAHWWSPGATYICYATFNDTNVPKEQFPLYDQSVYGKTREVPYPKAGDLREGILPVVTLTVVNIVNDETKPVTLNPPPGLEGRDHYVTHVTWRDDSHVAVTWMNRGQNFSTITLCNAQNGYCQVNMKEYSGEKSGWVAMTPPVFTKHIDQHYPYFLVLPQRDWTDGYFNHIAMITAPTNYEGAKTFLTHGKWEVTKVVGYSPNTDRVYFTSPYTDPTRRHLYSVETGIKKPKVSNEIDCVTCDVSKDCQWVDAKFSASGKYYILECLGPGVPNYTLRATDPANSNLNIVLQGNEILEELVEKKALPRKLSFDVDIGGGQTAKAQLMIPAELNEEHVTKYPVLFSVYGGPGSQQVTEKFKIGWETFLVSTQKILIASVDGRGTGGRGNKWLHSIYRQLGGPEVDDTIAAARHIAEMGFVDNEKLCIWGWSYGGFVTASVLGRGTGLFNCGIAVAPVTDWRYYDSAYTERYMRTPRTDDNYEGYQAASVMKKAQGFEGTSFLLIHGTADDNVHFQNSAHLMKALTEAGVEYRSQIYTDKDHTLSGPATRRHLYTTMTSFLLDNVEYLDETELQMLKRLSKFVKPEDA